MAHQIEIADSGEHAAAEPGETILDAALRAGVALPYSCQSGNCGTCKCEYLSGEIFELEHSEHALKAEERANNVILACRTQVWGDVAVRRIEAEELVLHPSRMMRCRVTGLESLTHDIREVRMSIEAGGPFTFSAGQYAQVEFAPGLSRHYSMANTPEEPELAFQIRRIPGGRTSGFVAERLKMGEGLKVSGPHGVSYLRDGHAGPVLLVAGGSGLAPVESILRTLLARGRGETVRLYFGVRAERDVYHEPRLKDLAARHANFSYQIVLSEPSDAPSRRSGFVHEAVAADIAGFSGHKAYLAGPPPMVEAATAMLLAGGLAQRDIHADAFYDQR
jgi:ferredoxin-NAD(P)+ reductase (naphthalene dioxygenase ferredoxin-specific)